MQLSKDVKITKVADASAAGTGEVTTTAVDMQGFEGVLFLVAAGAITATGVQSMNGAQGDSSGGAFDDLAGSKVDIADDDDNQAFFLDVFRPSDRFVRLEIQRATANSAFGEVYAIQYGGRTAAIDNNVTDEMTGLSLISPDEGTA